MSIYTFIHGERGSGKTTIAIAIAIELMSKKKKVLFLDDGPWYRDVYPVPLSLYINKNNNVEQQLKTKLSGNVVDCVIVVGKMIPNDYLFLTELLHIESKYVINITTE